MVKKLGSGLQGSAYELKDGRVLKLTKSFSEALNSKHLMENPSNYTVDFYHVGKTGGDQFFIIQEKVETQLAQKLFEDLIDFADEQYEYDFDSMLMLESPSYITISEEHAIFFDTIQKACKDLASKGIYAFDLTEGNVGKTNDGRFVVFDIETEDYEPTLEDTAYFNKKNHTDISKLKAPTL